ncbi:nucleoside hydrolase [Lactobacillus sp. ESL0791]|uniref:nucleoside hydrolase n=1 Tax=Lactobacillus sp. ESL0791 TaxID=2983234 RepID=UPI0023F7D759|nr:nucleoside hydrolase [Lactobacillus sp. ESL0791]MDF7639222.1 nucleoside hydrolase [Lactobacillus sp. ESL0791]
MHRTPLIISTDPGIDDAVAITIALFAPQLDLKLIVATWGNVALEKTLANAMRLETFLQTKVSVARGAQMPLLRPVINAAAVHGESGMAGYTFPEPDSRLLDHRLAAEALHEVVSTSPEKVTLMQIGPATDFALYFRQFPEDLTKIAKLVIMGGALGRGNWGPYSEYNVAGDPEAAQIVFSSGVPIMLAPLELGQQAFVDQQVLNKIRNLGRTGDMLYHLLTALNDQTANDGREIYDALAVGMLLRPDMYTFASAYVAVDTKSPLSYGASVIDFDDFFDKPQNAQVGVKVDRQEFNSWFVEAISRADKQGE